MARRPSSQCTRRGGTPLAGTYIRAFLAHAFLSTAHGTTLPSTARHAPLPRCQRLTRYEPEDDPAELSRLLLWSLSQPGVTAVLPPGSLPLLDPIVAVLACRADVPPFDDADLAHMRERYKDAVPIFHERDASGTKVTHG